MSFEQSKWVWMNGDVVPWGAATTHVSAHALHYGSGVFEGMRCYETSEGPAVFRIDAHLDRFYSSAEIYGLEIPYTRGELSEAVCEVIRRNDFSSCYVRPICYFGSASLNVHPRNCPVEVVILAWPWATYLGAAGLEQGVRVTVSPWRKFNSRMMPTTAKACGQYLNSILAVRDAVLQIARDLDYRVEIRVLELDDLLSADEAFFTGTAAEVTPISEVDETPIGNGARGPVTREIQEVFFAATSGRDERYAHWLHLVDAKRGQVDGSLSLAQAFMPGLVECG